jgi:aspartate/methionine/tyrosine aminotransferase
MAGVTPRFVSLHEPQYSFDPQELRAAFNNRTRLILINTPHNPTGYLMARDDYDAVHEFAREKNLIVFSDEVYRESEYDSATRLPAGCDYGGHAVSLGVTSKTYGLAGLRTGWVATQNRRIYERMASLKDYTTICNSAPSEFLAEVAMRNRKKLAERNINIIKQNLVIIDELFNRHSSRFQWVRPRAGSMAFPRYLGGNVDDFCDQLVTKAAVMLLPGTVYDDSENHFRLGLGRKSLPQAVERLEKFLTDAS